MSFMDSMQSLLDKVKQTSLFGGQEENRQMTSNMANGGFSGYRPATAKHRATRDTVRQQTTANAAAEQNAASGYDMGQQPMGGYQAENQWQQTGYQSTFQNTGYQAGDYQATGYQSAFQNTGYQAGDYQSTGYQSAFQNTGYQAPEQNQWQHPQQGAFQNTGYQGWQDNSAFGQTGYQQSAQPQQSNISYMPGTFVDASGRAYSHVERVAQVTQVAACYHIIEFMRNGESVIVNTELINDEMENQRCMDLLYGAAFAMNCTLTRISQRDIYLLSPATVMVVPYDSIRQMSDRDVNARWPNPEQANERSDRYADPYNQPRGGYRERRDYGRRSGYTNRYDDGYGGYQAAYAR